MSEGGRGRPAVVPPLRVQLRRPAHAAGDRAGAEGGRGGACTAADGGEQRPWHAWRDGQAAYQAAVEQVWTGGQGTRSSGGGRTRQRRAEGGSGGEREEDAACPFPRGTTARPSRPSRRLLQHGGSRFARSTPVLQGDLQALHPRSQDQGADRHRRQPRRQVPGCWRAPEKALKSGPRARDLESIAIAPGVTAAAIVDQTDIAAENMDLKLYR